MLLNRLHRLYHAPCFPMPVIILCRPAVLMVDYDRLTCAIWIFAYNPAVLRAVGEEFNIPICFPYDGEVPFPNQLFFSLREHKFSF